MCIAGPHSDEIHAETDRFMKVIQAHFVVAGMDPSEKIRDWTVQRLIESAIRDKISMRVSLAGRSSTLTGTP